MPRPPSPTSRAGCARRRARIPRAESDRVGSRQIVLSVPMVPPPQPSPAKAGESHVGLSKLLLGMENWILKVASDSEGARDGSVCGGFFGFAGSAGGGRAARSDGDVVHCASGDA